MDHAPTIILLGGAGDLATRMLLPSLYHLDGDGLLAEGTRIIGVARGKLSQTEYRALTREALEKRTTFDEGVWKRFEARLDFCTADLTAPEGGAKLNDMLPKAGLRVIFFSLSPTLYPAVCVNLKSMGVIDKSARLVLEKPIGKDLETSLVINDAVAGVADESRVFRIDHYLGKETVQNITALRFANTLFEPLWNNRHIDNVQITIAETEKIGDRWPYYDEYGAGRDMVQNHMLQLLCLVAMEPPATFDADAFRDEKVKVLRSLRRPTRMGVVKGMVRGQYTAGMVNGEKAAGYVEEVGKPTDTETFVAFRADIDNWRWSGVPFYLRTGKRLPERRTQIVIRFKPLPYNIFPGVAGEDIMDNKLVIDLQPKEEISMRVMVKRPGLGDIRLQALPLSLSFSSEDGGHRRIAYERLFLDVLRGDRSLFVRRDEVEQAWTYIDALDDAWKESGMKPTPYPAGTWGPTGVHALLERTNRTWHEGTGVA